MPYIVELEWETVSVLVSVRQAVRAYCEYWARRIRVCAKSVRIGHLALSRVIHGRQNVHSGKLAEGSGGSSGG